MEVINSKKERVMGTKRERFIRIAERRVNKILRDLDSLGKCSSKRNYEYTNEDVKAIFRAIDSKLKSVKAFYENSDQAGKQFSLKK